MSKLSSILVKAEKLSRFGKEFYRDMTLYIRHCGVSPWQDANKRRMYKLLIETHALEKGLSLHDPRPLFGKTKIAFVQRELDRYDLKGSPLPAEMVLGTLQTYVARHRDRGIDDPSLAEIETYVTRKTAELGIVPHGGLRHFDTAYTDVDNMAPADFLLSRFSSRTFSGERLDRDLVAKIVGIAQTAPSQCNRQSSHAHFFQSPEKISSLLELQGGSSGFAQDVRNLFVITSDLAAWGGAQQRNQLYVDGSLFSMALIYAIHAHGLATCPLNLAVTNARERDIKATAGIPADQRVIMMIAAGVPLTTTMVSAAASPRRELKEIMHFGD